MKVIILCVLLVILGVNAQTPVPCQCSTFECGCCVIGIPLINDLCANFTWTPSLGTLKADILVNNIPVWTDTIDGPQQLAVCVNVDPVTVCLTVEDLDVSTQGACGDVVLNASALIFEFSWDLGQITLGNCVNDEKIVIPVVSLKDPQARKKLEQMFKKQK